MKPYRSHVRNVAATRPPIRVKLYLEGITAISLPVNHFHNVLVDRLTALISITPVIRSTDTILAHVEVLGIVDVSVGAGLDTVDDLASGFSIVWEDIVSGNTKRTLGSRSIRMALGIYRVSSLW